MKHNNEGVSMWQRAVQLTILAAALIGVATPALANHSFGESDDIDRSWTGTITKMHFINPHSYMEVDVVGANGRKSNIHCEMRAATLLKRSGWSKEMFKVGARIEIDGHPHRTDANACYIENMKIGDAAKVNRNDQFQTRAVDTSKRPLRLRWPAKHQRRRGVEKRCSVLER